MRAAVNDTVSDRRKIGRRFIFFPIKQVLLHKAAMVLSPAALAQKLKEIQSLASSKLSGILSFSPKVREGKHFQNRLICLAVKTC